MKNVMIVILMLALAVPALFANGQKENSSGASQTQTQGVTKLTFWGWVPGFSRMVDLFNKTHPNISVDLQNVGAGTAEYNKLVTAAKAGSGAPDVAEIEYSELPTFEITHTLADMSKYGAGKYESDHVPGIWQQVIQGNAIYGMPFDVGPVSMAYNEKLFSQYGLTVPTTWAEFAVDAQKLHQANPKAQIMDFWPADAQFLFSMMSQTGAHPFAWDGGTNVTINLTSPKAIKFADFWQRLIDSNEVAMVPDIQAQEWNGLDSGAIATAPLAAWGPKYFAPAAKQSVGDWRIVPLPQWASGDHFTPSWGGSAYVVTAQSAHQKEATEFVSWLTSTLASWEIAVTPPTQDFPSMPAAQKLASFENRTIPLTGSQKVEQPYIDSAADLKTIEWLPFMTYVSSKASDTFNSVAEHKSTLEAAFQTLQNDLVSYAKAQGFTVHQ